MKSYKDYPYSWITLTEDGFTLDINPQFKSIMDFWGYCYVKDRPQDCDTNAKLVRLFEYLQTYEGKATLWLKTEIENKKHGLPWEEEQIEFEDIEIESHYTIYYKGKKYIKGTHVNDTWYCKDDNYKSSIRIKAGNTTRLE